MKNHPGIKLNGEELKLLIKFGSDTGDLWL
jgi:hypothetical protein